MSLRPRRNPVRTTQSAVMPGNGWYFHTPNTAVPNCSWCGGEMKDHGDFRVCLRCDTGDKLPVQEVVA